MTAHVGTHEYWVQMALEATKKVNWALYGIDKAERAAPRMFLAYDPAMHTPESLNVGPGVELIPVPPYSIQIFPTQPRRVEQLAAVQAVTLPLDLLFESEPDDEPEIAVWSGLRPNGLDLEGTHCTRRDVRTTADLDVRTKMMQAFCWPTAVHPYRWPS